MRMNKYNITFSHMKDHNLDIITKTIARALVTLPILNYKPVLYGVLEEPRTSERISTLLHLLV